MSGSAVNYGNQYHPSYYDRAEIAWRGVVRLALVAFAIAVLSWGFIGHKYYDKPLRIGLPVDEFTWLVDAAFFSTLLTIVVIGCGLFRPVWRALVRFVYAPTLGHIITALGDPTYGPTPPQGTWAYTRTRFTLALFCAGAVAGLGYIGRDLKAKDALYQPLILTVTLVIFVGCIYLSLVLSSVLTAIGRRLWFGRGWLYNENTRQWEQVVGRDRFGYLTNGEDHTARRSAAMQGRKARGDNAFTGLVIGGIAAAILWEFYQGSPHIQRYCGDGPFSWTVQFFGACFIFIGGLQSVALLLGSGAGELAHQLNFSHGNGPKVRDPMPQPRPGREAVEGEKGHGNAKPARESDVGKALGGKPTQSDNRRFKN